MKIQNDIIQLTWLRGVAALLVVFSHICRTLDTKTVNSDGIARSVLTYVDLGSFGVTLFFTLSGCTLYLSIDKTGFNTKYDWIIFYSKRFFRVWPAFFISLILYIIAGYFFKSTLIEYSTEWISKQFVNQYYLRDFVNYSLFVFNFTGPQGLFNNAYWSLPIEFQYYILLPFIYILSRKIKLISPLIFSVALYIIYKQNPHWTDSILLFWLGYTFCLGAAIGYIYTKIQFKIHSHLSFIIIFLSYSFLVSFNSGILSDFNLPSEWNVYGLMSLLVVFVVLFSNIALPKPIGSLLKFYGEISYSLYLYHNLILGLLTVLYLHFLKELFLLKEIYFLVLTILLSTVVAYISFKHIELPSINYGKRAFKK